MVEWMPEAIFEAKLNFELSFCNQKGFELIGYSADDLKKGLNTVDLFAPEDRDRIRANAAKRLKGEVPDAAEYQILKKNSDTFPATFKIGVTRKEGEPVGFKVVVFDITEFKQVRERLVTEIEQHKQVEKERKKLIKELKEALANIKTLSGLLPICSHCKKIRDDKGYWNKIEGYIQKHSTAQFSHGICPECSDELYGNEDWYIEMKKH